MGDPGGIGPEVIVRAWADPAVHESARLVVLGHPEIMRRAAAHVRSEVEIKPVDSTAALAAAVADVTDAHHMACLTMGDDAVLDAPTGVIDARAGEAAYQAVVRATRGALAGEFDGLVTAPLNKAGLHAAGHWYPGHTELLAELCGVDDFAMMLYLPAEELARQGKKSQAGLGVIHSTLHCAMRDVFDQLTPERIAAKCGLANAVFAEGFGVEQPRIGVLALNPHAGESGLFGDEESRIIEPGVKLAQQSGINAAGPYPADTLLIRAVDGEFDGVVAMYHDQGHIALKLLGMHRAVNITLGLPIVRTSVAHGTAFDKAWSKDADTSPAESTGMVAAIKAASELARRGFHFKTTNAGVIA
ncbi:4-hydroxythreonine-4-phosphate dehydrogenase [Adhaeretor mobilis]|uniref:4-hydroxythreonine-4-phosphate dehydrogenase n=2 Tax=Adhaeretor mobilis TaxID=1930276 RepID=A0A517N0A4_9BACT|nr:4-hydroxythreonine-4-phosphate dehydrogenase [Adhaeretor mobilis]